ncbi:MAG: hypothetical protein V3T86_04870 [Planctomycetota bacterium]
MNAVSKPVLRFVCLGFVVLALLVSPGAAMAQEATPEKPAQEPAPKAEPGQNPQPDDAQNDNDELPADAQTPEHPVEDEQAGVTAKEDAIATVGAVERGQGFVAAIKVKREQHNPFGGKAQIIINGAGLDSGDKFEGGLELWRTDAGATVLLSRKRLPGFALFLDGERSITETTYGEERISLRELKQELSSLLELDRLLLWMKKAKWERGAADALTGEVAMKANISHRLVRTDDDGVGAIGMALGGRAKVLRVEMGLTRDGNNQLTEMRFRVVRSNPLKGIMRIAMQQGGGGGNNPPMPPIPEQSDEGAATNYVISFRGGRPSGRAKAFRKRAKELLVGQGE